MSKHIFIERGVEVNFDEEWTVVKLDKHRYYKRISGLGVSGVDFMAVHPIFGLALIEMKNYTKGKASIPKNLDIVMIKKKSDTIRLINIIYTYYRRQKYFQLLTFIGWEYLYPREWKIWMEAKKHVDIGNYFFLGIIDY